MFILISAWTRRTGLAKSCTQNRHMMRNRYSSHFSFPNNSSTFNLSIPHFSWKIDFILFTILSIDSLILKRDFFFNFIFPVLQTSISSISSCSVKKTRLVLSVCIFSLDQYQLMGLKKTSKYFLSKQCFHISQYYVTIPHFATAQNYLSGNLARIEFQAGEKFLFTFERQVWTTLSKAKTQLEPETLDNLKLCSLCTFYNTDTCNCIIKRNRFWIVLFTFRSHFTTNKLFHL